MKVGAADALVVVDMQNDFFHGGALPVNGANRIVPIVNSLINRFGRVVFTRNWRPEDHSSFADPPEFLDGSWPVHCAADSPGAEFHGDLHVPVDALIVSTGVDPDKPGHSAFEDTTLAQDLRARGVTRMIVCGLATDYGVKCTALDGVKEGFEVILLEDACRGIDFPPGSAAKAIEAMRSAGVQIQASQDIE